MVYKKIFMCRKMGRQMYAGGRIMQRHASRLASRLPGSSLRRLSHVRAPARKQTRTRTKTRTKTKLTQKIGPQHRDGPMSDSYFAYPRTGKSFSLKGLKKVISPQFFITNTPVRLDCGVGVQAVTGFNGATTSIPGMNTVVDLTSIMGQSAAAYTGASATNPKTQKIYLNSCRMELLMSNATNDVINVKIYDVIARRDITASSYANPAVSWAVGNTDEGLTNLYTTVGSTPFQAPGFTEFWCVQKVTDVNLHTGGHHKHTVTIKPKRMFSDELLQSVGATAAAIAKFTAFSMIVIHGYPVNDNTTKTQVSTSSCSLDIIWRKQYEWQIFERSTVAVSQTNNLVTAFTVAPELMSDVIGTVQAVLNA
jgi:hypothetical protein